SGQRQDAAAVPGRLEHGDIVVVPLDARGYLRPPEPPAFEGPAAIGGLRQRTVANVSSSARSSYSRLSALGCSQISSPPATSRIGRIGCRFPSIASPETRAHGMDTPNCTQQEFLPSSGRIRSPKMLPTALQ